MQRNEVKAFRQRLIRAGFKDIFISENVDGTYYVSCKSPNGYYVKRLHMTVVQMNAIPHLVYFPEVNY